MAKKVKQKNNSGNIKRIPNSNIKSTDSEKIVWCFDRIDRDGYFRFDTGRGDFNHREVLQKIIDYSNMTWNEVKSQTHDKGKSKHHFLSVDGISQKGIERIQIKKLFDDADSIFSFAFQNKLRIIGIRSNEKFHVVWYDPFHEFFESSK